MAQWLKPALVWLGVMAASMAVFVLYMNPDFIVTTANQVWLCAQ